MKKDDSNELVTKGFFRKELKKELKKEFKKELKPIYERFDKMDVKFDNLAASHVSLEERVTRIEENMYTKQDHAKFMIWMDEAMKELRDSRHERVLQENQVLRMDYKLDDHEKRLRVLEKR